MISTVRYHDGGESSGLPGEGTGKLWLLTSCFAEGKSMTNSVGFHDGDESLALPGGAASKF